MSRVWTLTVSCLSVSLVMAAVASLTTALPDLARDTEASQTQMIWIVDAYTLVLACALLPAGAVGDRYGRRRLLLAGLAVFAAGSALPVMFDAPAWVIACRAVAGLGAALVMPATLSILTAEFPARQASRAVGVWAGFAGAGAVLGILGAGALLAAWSWRSVFAATALLALILLVASCVLPRSRESEAHRLDVPGAVLSAAAVGLVVFGVIEAPDHGWGSLLVVGALSGGMLAGAGFIVVERRRRAPLLDVRLFAERGFGTGAASLVVQFLAAFGLFVVLMQHLQLVWGYSPLGAGLALAPLAVPLVVMAVLAPWLTERVGLRVMTGTGLCLVTLALIGIAGLGVEQNYPRLAVFITVFGLGLGICATPATAAIVHGVPRAKQGVASAVNDATRELGAAIGIALAGSLLASSYRTHITPDMAMLPEAVRMRAGDSLAGALHAATTTDIDNGFIAAAHQAFADGMHDALITVAAVTATAAAVLVLRAPGRAARNPVRTPLDVARRTPDIRPPRSTKEHFVTDQQLISDYPHRLAGHCGSGALRDLMQWAGLSYDLTPLDEGTIFGLGGELGFSYLRHPALTPAIYLVGRGHDLTGAFTRRLGITAAQRTTDDPGEGWDWVREELDHGYPVLCWADIAELPYLRVRLSMSRHDIVIIGYNDHTRTATVVDNDRADPQPVTYDALARARCSTGFPVPTRHTTYRLRFPTQLPPLWATAADACRAAATALRHTHPLFEGHLDNTADLVHGSGLAGVNVFVDDLHRWPDVFPPDQLDTVLKSLAAFIDKAGTGGGLFRRLQADYLHYLAGRTTLPTARQAAETYTRLAQLWHDLATTATADTDPTARAAALVETAEQLPALEQQGAHNLDILALDLTP